MEDYLRKPGNGPEKLLHLLEVSHKKGALISCTLGGSHVAEAVNQKLQHRHAYTVIGMTKVSFREDFTVECKIQVRGGRNGKLVIPLMRLRDPHGAGIRFRFAEILDIMDMDVDGYYTLAIFPSQI